MKKYFTPYSFSIMVGAVTIALLAGWYAFAFTGPTQTPPNCPPGTAGCDPPINTSSNAQTRAGDLDITNGLNALLSADLLFVGGNADIGGDIIDGGITIYDSSINKIDPAVLPFNQGDLIAPGDRPLISGLGAYTSDYFNLGRLGIDPVTDEASNVLQGVTFGPGNSITGTASVGAETLLPGDVIAAGAVGYWHRRKLCDVIDHWGHCTGASFINEPEYAQLQWHDPRGNVLNLSSPSTRTVWGCYESGSNCTTPLVVDNYDATFSCTPPYVHRSGPIYNVYQNTCNLFAGGNRSCLGTRACYPP